MIKTWQSTLLSIYLASILTGCMAYSPAVGIEATVAGLRGAIVGAPGTFVCMNPNVSYVLFGWQQGTDYAFLFVDRAGNVLKDWSQLFGTRASWQDAASFLKFLEKRGWAAVPAGLVAAEIAAIIRQLAFTLAMSRVALPTLFVLPGRPLIPLVQEVGA